VKAGFAGVRRVGLFGGSFDPVHAGHLHVARASQERARLERIVFVPAARPPHKPGRVLASGAHRLAMLALALEREPAWSTSGIELERSGPSYTWDTVLALPERLGLDAGCRLFLLLGSDNLPGIAHWHRAQQLLARVEPLVVHRGEDLGPALRELGRSLPAHLVERITAGLIEVAPWPLSSSELRAALARGEDPGPSLPPGVLEYIRAHGIYAAPPC
jgi:nicotinate-nucleotide adenylyltransferase